MWQPTHVKVTVKQAKNLNTKGKSGTNDAFVVIGIGKEKYQTSVKEKALPSVEWREECELSIPSQGNKAMIQLTVYHHNGLGMDEFLGQVSLPLSDFDVYEKPKYRSYRLKGKPEKDKKKGEKERGELELMVNFIVKSGSFLDVSKKEKHKSSITSLKHLGGSLMSIGAKEKQGLKNFAKSVSSKMDKIAKPRKKKVKSPEENYSGGALSNDLMASQQHYGDADPGVISDEDDDDDFRFDDDVKVNTRTSSPLSTMSRTSSLMHEQVLDTDFEVGSCEDHDPDFSLSFGKTPPKPPRIVDETREAFPPRDDRPPPLPAPPERITSFSSPKPSFRMAPSTPEISRTIIEEEVETRSPEPPLAKPPPEPLDIDDDPRPGKVEDDLNLAPLTLHPPRQSESSFLSALEGDSAPSPFSLEFHSPKDDLSFSSYKHHEEEDLRRTSSKEEPRQPVFRQDKPSSSPHLQASAETKKTPPQPALRTEAPSSPSLKSSSASEVKRSPPQPALRREKQSSPPVEAAPRPVLRQMKPPPSPSSPSPSPSSSSSYIDLPTFNGDHSEGGHDSAISLGNDLESLPSSVLSSAAGSVLSSSSSHSTKDALGTESSVIPTQPKPVQPSEPKPEVPLEPVQPSEPKPEVPSEPEPVQPSEPEPVVASEPESPAKKSDAKVLLKASSDMDVLVRHSSGGRRLDRPKRVLSAADSWSFSEADAPARARSGSLSEKSPVAMATPPPQPTLVDDWERKLYGRSGMTGSTENMSISGSRSSLNTSRESSIHDIRREDSFTRLPEVKALTLERKTVLENEEEGKKHKRKAKTGFKHRFFNKIGGSRERLNEESRFVEGGNDRLPSIPSRPFKLPQEVHDKFAGKSREDLLEVILNLQATLEKQAKHSTELEEYIDNLLLRVMEATPHILQAPVKTGGSLKRY